VAAQPRHAGARQAVRRNRHPDTLRRGIILDAMNIGLTYDLQTDPSDERQAEFDAPATLEALRVALESLDYSVVLLGNANQLIADHRSLHSVDIVFNIAEGSFGRCREAWVPMLLEQWGVPFIGSTAAAQALGLDKVMSKRLALASGVQTPPWWLIADAGAPLAEHLPFPLIVKPCYEGSGLGIDPQAVVYNDQALRKRVDNLIARFKQPCLVEQFIPFGELTVFLTGNHPPQAYPVIQRPLDVKTRLSTHVAGEIREWFCPVELTPALDSAAREAAVKVFEALGCRDMARVDFRVDEAGQVYFLEINPLPSFAPDGTIGLLAEFLGITYAQLVGRIVDAAIDRIKQANLRLE